MNHSHCGAQVHVAPASTINMDITKMTTKELERKSKTYRSEALSQTFVILALISSAMLSEALSIIHEYIKENHITIYNEWAWVIAVVGLIFSVMVIVLAYAVSVRGHGKIQDELGRRMAKRKK